MREEIPSSRLWAALVLAGLVALAPGCGDGPICASDIAVFITAPDDGTSFYDGDDGIPGFQTDVTVRTNLRAGERVDLSVIDELGFRQFYSTTVDPSGTARFPFLTLPEGEVDLEAIGVTEQCGSGADVVEIRVGGGTTCSLQLLDQPIANDFYPLPVLNGLFDPNPLVDGYQASVNVFAQPDFVVELVAIDPQTGLETSAGARVVDFAGQASYTLTLAEGAQTLEARCQSPTGAIEDVSNQISVFVDTVAPVCTLVSPVPDQDLSPLLDADGDPANGTQIELVAVVEDVDATGAEPLVPLLFVNEVSFEGSAVDADGESRATATIEREDLYVMGVSSRDRAGNPCADSDTFRFTNGGLFLEVLSRSSVGLSWITPAVLGDQAERYLVRVAQEPLDTSNFDSAGELVADVPVPGAPGAPASLVIDGLTPGVQYYAAVVAESAAGVRVFVGAAGPAVLGFDATGAIGPVAPADGDNALGYQVAAGDFNGDSFGDLAVSAPDKIAGGEAGAGAVYVYFGAADGVLATPDVTIEGSTRFGALGRGLTTVRWNDDAIDDLAVGEPFGNGGNGRVRVFLGGSTFAGNDAPEDAEVSITGSGAAGDWLATSGLGFALTRARFDADARDDLVITAPGGGAGNGGVVVLYGGATATDIVLSSQSAAGSGDAVALVLEDPDPGSIFTNPPAPFFGHHVFPLGRTQGASDGDDDIGVAYTEKNAAVVFRGRARPAGAGVTVAAFDAARDLEIRRLSSTDASSRFGTSMGSIADLNNDGAREIVVGMWRDLANLGRIEIYDGDRVGVQNASNIRLRSITPSAELCGAGGCGLGSAVVNNAAGLIDPDVNGDGLEDLIVVGGMGAGRVAMLVWFGGSIPATPDISSSTAQYVIPAPVEFEGAALGDSDATPITALWAGDINGDGLEDICWADWSASGRDGAFVLLHDAEISIASGGDSAILRGP
jgi:hypothetical protein